MLEFRYSLELVKGGSVFSSAQHKTGVLCCIVKPLAVFRWGNITFPVL